jgi:rhodanese-related sulfurtransferase
VAPIDRSGRSSVDTGLAAVRAGFGEPVGMLEGFKRALEEHHRHGVSAWCRKGLPWGRI